MDQSRDLNGQQLYKLIQLYPPPDYVKQASVGELCGEGELPPHVYGDPLHKMFPCHTAAATWTSTAFFLDKKAEFSKDDAKTIADRLQRFASVHGITNSINDLREKVASNCVREYADWPDSAFAVVINHGVSKGRYYPLRNSKEVVAAAKYLNEHRDALPFNYRQAFADKILQKAAQLGVNLGKFGEMIEKQAGHGACSAKECAEFILDRVYASRQGPGKMSELQVEMLKLAKMIASKPSSIREAGALCKIANVIDDFDRHYCLHTQYGDKLKRIEDVLFGLTREKMASVAKDFCATITGSIYKLADLERIRVQDVRDYFGDDVADSVTSDGLSVDSEKAAEVIPTLPRGDAEMFDRLMSDRGIRPMAKEASAYSVGISREYLHKLAASRQVALVR